MYSQKDLSRVLLRCVRAEIEAIKFYSGNLNKLNYKDNKTRVDALLLESFDHAKMLAKAHLALNSESKGKITKQTREKALKEETGLKEVYKYILNRTDDPKVKTTIKKIIKDEIRHEALVAELK